MRATLYLPKQAAVVVPTEGLFMSDAAVGCTRVTERVAELLDCSLSLVDVLASGAGYVAYSVFDYEEGLANSEAMQAVAEIANVAFDEGDDDSVLRGPVLLVRLD